MLKSEIDSFDMRVKYIRNNLMSTDIYIERYLPCLALNQIKECLEDAFGDYNDRKSFLTIMKKRFHEMQHKIQGIEKQEKEQASYSANKQICTLNKTNYSIPEIDVPVTLSETEEEQSAHGEEDLGEGEGEDEDYYDEEEESESEPATFNNYDSESDSEPLSDVDSADPPSVKEAKEAKIAIKKQKAEMKSDGSGSPKKLAVPKRGKFKKGKKKKKKKKRALREEDLSLPELPPDPKIIERLKKEQIENFGNEEAGIEDYQNMSLFNSKLQESFVKQVTEKQAELGAGKKKKLSTSKKGGKASKEPSSAAKTPGGEATSAPAKKSSGPKMISDFAPK